MRKKLSCRRSIHRIKQVCVCCHSNNRSMSTKIVESYFAHHICELDQTWQICGGNTLTESYLFLQSLTTKSNLVNSVACVLHLALFKYGLCKVYKALINKKISFKCNYHVF